MKIIFGGALILVLLILTGVIAYNSNLKKAPTPPSPTIAPTITTTKEASPLAGTSWKLVVFMQNGVSTPIPEGAVVTANFDETQIGGNNSCNSYSGSYSTSGESITIGKIGSTLMACDEPRGSFETDYMKTLREAGSFKLHSGNKLTIYSAVEGKTALDYEKTN